LKKKPEKGRVSKNFLLVSAEGVGRSVADSGGMLVKEIQKKRRGKKNQGRVWEWLSTEENQLAP